MTHSSSTKILLRQKGFIGISHFEDKTDNQSDSKGENLINVRSERDNLLNCKIQYETHDNVVVQGKSIYKAHKVLEMMIMDKWNLKKMCCCRTNHILLMLA